MVELKNNYKELKPMLCVNEMISYLKNKNIKFNYISESDALKYLKDNNNYYNLTSYKHNFLKYPSPAGKFEGKYQDLDFAYLKDLSIIDYRVRLVLFKMIINIEYYLKMKILNTIENIDEEDGYRIVNLYLDNDFNSDKFQKNCIIVFLKRLEVSIIKRYFLNMILIKIRNLKISLYGSFLRLLLLENL